MGVMIRLPGVNVNNSNLPVVNIPFNGITEGLKLATAPRKNIMASRDVSGNGVVMSLIGDAVFSDKFVSGGSNSYLKAAYNPAANSSRTMIVIARPVANGASNAFFMGDYKSGPGCNIFWDNVGDKLRCQVNIDNGSGSTIGAFPGTLPGIGAINTSEFFFVALSVDAVNKTAKVHVPHIGYSYAVSWTTSIPYGIGYLAIAGNDSSSSHSNVCYATYHDRALTASEIEAEYVSSKTYMEILGVRVQ
ncbi:hypothetical protein [Serratia fonticola]